MRDRFWTLMSWIVNDGAAWDEVRQKWRLGWKQQTD